MSKASKAQHILLEGNQLRLSGDWTLKHYASLRQQLALWQPKLKQQRPEIDLQHLGQLDTAGASVLVELLGPERLQPVLDTLNAERRALLETLATALTEPPQKPQPSRYALGDVLEHIGITLKYLWDLGYALLGFMGLTLSSLVRAFFRPSRWRITSMVSHIEQCGLNAVPIVALLTFMVGAVVAFLGATVLANFGASIYTIDLVAFSFLREFGVLLTAILMAGRTASAFTAQIGSMKANEEVDAIRTLGLDPIELLVLPRVLALLISLPLLTFIGMLCGILGGAVVCVWSLDISATMYWAALQNDIEVRHFIIGLVKAPLFAFLIAIIGCLEGFKVAGSAQSVGAHTTSAVVQSIFIVILLDALAALFFMEMGW